MGEPPVEGIGRAKSRINIGDKMMEHDRTNYESLLARDDRNVVNLSQIIFHDPKMQTKNEEQCPYSINIQNFQERPLHEWLILAWFY